MRIEYPQNVASWDYFNLVVNASGVAGTEGRANFEGWLAIPAASITKKDSVPPFSISPYGVKPSPVIVVQIPGTNKTAQLCTEPD